MRVSLQLTDKGSSASVGWTFQGCLENAKSKLCADGKDYDLGAMWECPFFVHLEDGSSEGAWVLCVSPYPHHCTDRPTNPCLYWIGSFQENTFQMDRASGQSLRCFFSYSALCQPVHASFIFGHLRIVIKA